LAILIKILSVNHLLQLWYPGMWRSVFWCTSYSPDNMVSQPRRPQFNIHCHKNCKPHTVEKIHKSTISWHSRKCS